MATEVTQQTVEHFNLCLLLTNAAAKQINEFARIPNGPDGESIDQSEARRKAETYLKELLGIGRKYFWYLRHEGHDEKDDKPIISLVLATDQDNGENRTLLEKISEKTLIITGIEKTDGFLVTDFKAVSQGIGKNTAYSFQAYAKVYFPGTTSYFDKTGFPSAVIQQVASLPERKAYELTVEKRLETWHAFLDIQERITREKQYMVGYKEYRESKNARLLIFEVTGDPEHLPWEKIKSSQGQEISLVVSEVLDTEAEDFEAETLGIIEDVDDHKWTITVKLEEEIYKQLSDLSSGYKLPGAGFLFYRPQWGIAEIKKQRRGLERLQRGEAQNRNLSEFIFDPAQARVKPEGEKVVLSPENMLLKSLNPSQIKAVEGALNCQDLFLIKGPPGTGKTTVIAEICYQLAKRGKRVLIASQTNLAVDNAISKIVHDPSIRVLRVGREGGIEQEGIKFVEGEVVKTWLQNTANYCKSRMQKFKDTARNREFLEQIAAILNRSLQELKSQYEFQGRVEGQIKQQKAALERFNMTIDSLAKQGTQKQTDLELMKRLQSQVQQKDESAIDESIILEHAAFCNDEDYLRYLEDIEKFAFYLNYLVTGKGERETLERKKAYYALKTGLALARKAEEVKKDYSRCLVKVDVVGKLIDDFSRTVQERKEISGQIQKENLHLEQTQQEKDNCREEIQKNRREIAGLNQLKSSLAQKTSVITNYEVEIQNKQLEKIKTKGSASNSWIYAYQGRVLDQITDFLEEELKSSLWETCYSMISPTLHQVNQKYEEIVTSKDTYERLVELRNTCSNLLNELKTAYNQLGLNVTVYKEDPFHEILRKKDNGRWVLLHNAEGEVADKGNKYLEGGFINRTYLKVMNIFNSQKADVKKAERIGRGILVFTDFLSQLETAIGETEETCRKDESALRQIPVQVSALITENLTQCTEEFIKKREMAITDLENKCRTLEEELLQSRERISYFKDHELQKEKEQRVLLDKINQYNFSTCPYVPLQLFEDWRSKVGTNERLEELKQQWQDHYSQLGQYLREIEQEPKFEYLASALVRNISGLEQELNKLETEQTKTREELMAAEKAVERLTKDLETSRQYTARENERLSKDLENLGVYTHHLTAKLFAGFEEIEFNPQIVANLFSEITTLKKEYSGEAEQWQRYEGLVEEWVARLEKSDPDDIANLKKTYIANTNVIGATCSISGRKTFIDEYGKFDLVIVDEVSKATPPELLLPALLGEKIVLVGDDRQLPPMIGPDTLEELAKELDENKENLSHLERSLYADLWAMAPDELKAMLTVQYRMHPSIMRVINQFYDDQLQCGLENPDQTRAHGLEGLYFDRSIHTVWFDLPRSDEFEEKRAPNRSYYNEKEIFVIEKLLEHFDQLWQAQVAKGMPRKEIGVITFYAAQAKKMEQSFFDANGEGKFANLDLRIGTVDRFQGMERPVVIVSMVRNNQKGNIGFAAKPERINVAFSRAQELLVIVGCAQLFCGESTSQAMQIYQNVEEVIRREGKLGNVWEILKG